MKNPKTAFVTMIALILVCTLVVGCTFTGSIQGEIKENGEETEPVGTTELAETTLPSQSTEPTETTPPEKQITTNLNVTEDDPYFYWYMRLDGSGAGANWYNTAMGHLFSDSSQINPYYLFYNGHYGGSWDLLDASTASALVAQGFDRDKGLQVMPRETLEWVMTEIFATPLEQVMPDIPEGWVYLEETDTYYSNHNDTHGITEFRIYGVEETNNGLIYVSYEPLGDSSLYADGFKVSGSDMVLTLQYDGDGEGGYYVLANQLSGVHYNNKIKEPRFDCKIPEKPQAYKAKNELTDEQIAAVNEAFQSARYWEENGLKMGGSYAIANFFTSYYSNPAEIDFREFMRYFSAYGVVNDYNADVTEEEFYTIINMDWWPFGNDFKYENREWQQVPIHKTPAWVVEEVLNYYTGIGLDDLNDLSRVEYLEEYDSFYTSTSDAGYGTFNCVTGFIYDGYVELYSEDSVLTLREENGRYYIYSHLPLEVVEFKELTTDQIARVNEAFTLTYEDDSGDVCINPICCFFTSYYTSPTEISLVDFMRYFSADGVVENPDYEVSEEEFYALTKLKEWPFENVKKPEDLYVPIHGYPAETINAVLERYAGAPLNALKDAGKSTSSLMYLPKYDTYYNYTSDFGLGIFSCIGGRIYEGYVELYSEDAVLTLREENGRYYINSHLPIE